MPRDFLQEANRLNQAGSISNKLNNIQDSLNSAKQIISQLSTARQSIVDGIVSGIFDQDDLDTFDAKATAILTASLKAIKDSLNATTLFSNKIKIQISNVEV